MATRAPPVRPSGKSMAVCNIIQPVQATLNSFPTLLSSPTPPVPLFSFWFFLSVSISPPPYAALLT